MSSPVASLDRTDCRILRRLNDGLEMQKPAFGNRVDRLIEAGFISEGSFGEVNITPRGQLELARLRFRDIPRNRIAVLGPVHRNGFFRKLFRFSKA